MGHFAAVWDQRASIEITKDWNGIDQVTLRSPRSASARQCRLAYMVVRLFHGGVIKGKNFYSQVVRILRRRRGDKTSKTSFALPRCFSSVLDGLKYATSHEWVKHEGPVATIGITDRAQDHLGEVVFVELPETGVSVSKGSSFGAVESVKATSDVNSPISGEVVEVNSKLTEAPGMINSSPYKEGWMIKVKPSTPAELDSLMGAKEYTKFCEEEDAAH